MRLIEELALGRESRWGPYLEMLPALPVNAFGFTEDALRLLELTASVPQITQWQRAADVLYHNKVASSPASLPQVP